MYSNQFGEFVKHEIVINTDLAKAAGIAIP
jgi:hypothetical protein